MVSLSRIGMSVATTAFTASVAFNAAANEPENTKPRLLTVSTQQINQELDNNCLLYTNILKKFDKDHIGGKTKTPHSEMATIALKGAISSAIQFSKKGKKPTNVRFDEKANDLPATVTFADGSSHTIGAVTGDVTTHADQCNILDPSIKILSEKTGVPIAYLYEGSLNTVITNTYDPHSGYTGPRDAQSFMDNHRGSFEGIGAEISMDQTTGYLEIITPIEGSPALKAGIKKGDLITHIDGKETKNMPINDIVTWLKGPRGTVVNVTVKGKSDVVPITRDVIEQKTVIGKLVGDTLQVQIKHFNEKTYQQFVKAVSSGMAEWASQTATNLKKLMIDVRNDPGGDLGVTLQMLDRLINQDNPNKTKQIMATGKSADNLETKYFNDTITRQNFPKFKIGILINGRSASASEILAGALMDEGHESTGHRTYGKGSVQSILPVNSKGEFVDRHGPNTGFVRLTGEAFFPGTSVLSNQGHGIPPTTKVIYGDFRDELAKKSNT